MWRTLRVGRGGRRVPDTNDPGCLDPGSVWRVLAAQPQRADDGSIARGVLLDQIRKKAPALSDELEEAASRMMILGEAGEESIQVPDPRRQERDLDLGRPGVAVLDGVSTDDLLLLLPRERHSILRHERWRDYMTSILDRRRIASVPRSGKRARTGARVVSRPAS